MADVGDPIEVSQTKGQPARTGLVIAIQGRMVSVRWDSGEESKLVPGPGAISVLGRGRPSPPSAATGSSPPAPRPPPVKRPAKATKRSTQSHLSTQAKRRPENA